MPSNYTSNYSLNQWEASDQVLRTDFNADNAKIDAAIAAVDTKTDQKADQSALSALQNVVNTKADQSALEAEISARSSAVSTINRTLSGKGNCRVETFRYTGVGGYTRSLTFSGRPTFFVVFGENTAVFAGGPEGMAACVFNVDGRSANQLLNISWSGNTATLSGDQRAVPNVLDNTYQVVALYAED